MRPMVLKLADRKSVWSSVTSSKLRNGEARRGGEGKQASERRASGVDRMWPTVLKLAERKLVCSSVTSSKLQQGERDDNREEGDAQASRQAA